MPRAKLMKVLLCQAAYWFSLVLVATIVGGMWAFAPFAAMGARFPWP